MAASTLITKTTSYSLLEIWFPFTISCITLLVVILFVIQLLHIPTQHIAADSIQQSVLTLPKVNLDLTLVKDAALFGKEVIQAPPPAPEIPFQEIYEETTLSLTLVGVFTQGAVASALISNPSDGTQRYFVNDFLPGDAQLVSIRPLYVILKYNDNLQSLHFDKATYDAHSAHPQSFHAHP